MKWMLPAILALLTMLSSMSLACNLGKVNTTDPEQVREAQRRVSELLATAAHPIPATPIDAKSSR